MMYKDWKIYMKYMFYTALVAILGACSPPSGGTDPTPSSPVIGTGSKSATGEYYFVRSDLFVGLGLPNSSQSDGDIDRWVVDSVNLYNTAAAYSDANVVAGGGLASNHYFAGITGITSSNIPVSAIAYYQGGYSLVVNGISYSAPLNLTADFTAGTLTDTSSAITVDAIISGADITGTVEYLGQSGALKGGFYGNEGQTVVGAVLGSSTAGVIVGQALP